MTRQPRRRAQSQRRSPLHHLAHRVHEPQDEGTLYRLGYVRLSDLQSMTVRVPPGSVGMGLERDLEFKPSHSIGVYAESARENGTITDNAKMLYAAQDRP